MTTRDLFAAHAMQTIQSFYLHAPGYVPEIQNADLAREAFDLADAMMEERHRRKQPKADEAL